MGKIKPYHTIFIKILALLSTIRWYNILLTIIAQYISAYTILQHQGYDLAYLLKDFKLHCIVVATVLTIAAGFIINNFYDYEKDLINRPNVTKFHEQISKNTILNSYFIFNILAIIIAWIASIKVAIFFIIFSVALWFYSHKIQKIPFIKEFAASILSITSFFAIVFHYNSFYFFIFVYGVLFMSFVYSRELVKQFINYQGDLVLQYPTIPILLGISKAKYFVYFIICLSLFYTIAMLLAYHFIPILYLYLIISMCLQIFSIYLIKNKKFQIVNLLYKLLILGGIFQLVFF